jgi:hypothetical protein
MAISTTAAGLLLFAGKEVVKLDRISKAIAWIEKPHINSVLRPKRSTVKVLTRTIKSCSTDWMPLMARAFASR